MIPLCEPKISGNEWKYMKDCLDTNWVSSVGAYVDLFEKNFKQYLGADHAVVTTNGTAALTLALQVLGVGNGDEVIVPSMTFSATVNPILYVGAKPVFADITKDTWVLDVNKVKEAITSKTKAIMPVHLYGNMVDMHALNLLAKEHNLYVVEDATESLGSLYQLPDGTWHSSGTLGDIGCFSFNGNKIITTGAGGMLTTNNKTLGEKAKHISNQAKTIHINGGMFHEEMGYNYRMPNLLAAMGVAQLECLHDYVAAKAKQAQRYNENLKNTAFVCPTVKENVQHSQWLYCVLAESEQKRDLLLQKLKENQIGARPFFACLHEMKPYAHCKSHDLTVSKEISGRGINLPSSVGLPLETIDRICELLCQ